MLGPLIKKELSEKLVDSRFAVTSLLCIIVMPLGMYVSCQDYERRLADHRDASQAYRERFSDEMSAFVEVQGFRPPSALSVFALGLDAFIPDKIVTARSGRFHSVKEPVTSSPGSLLFGRTDYLFYVTFVLSLAALTMTFDSIAGEKEAGTLKLMISHAVSRRSIVLSKIIGNYVSILLPFVVSLMVALLFLEGSSVISLGSTSLWTSLLALIAVTMLYLFVMTCLGVWVSTQRHHSINALIVAFFVWTLLTLAIPKISPMMARVLYPIKSPDAINSAKGIVIEDFENELDRKRLLLFRRCHDEFDTPRPDRDRWPASTEAGKKALAKYGKEATLLEQAFQRRITDSIQKIERDDQRQRNRQFRIAINISRISPVSCFVYVVSRIAGTGVTEPLNFVRNAARFQTEVNAAIYEQYDMKMYPGASLGGDAKSGFDPARARTPVMTYRYATLAQALGNSWVDILLLGCGGVLFYGTAYRGLQNYDVR